MKRLSVKQIRLGFFEGHPQYKNEYAEGKKHERYSWDCRCAFGHFAEALYRYGDIDERTFLKITLG